MKRADTRTTGELGEDAVAARLESAGYVVLARNARVGRLELDIVARRGQMLVFVEVKTAAEGARVSPIERLRPAQVERLRRAAALWMAAHPARSAPEVRFDAAAVQIGSEEPSIEYYEAAF